MISKNRNNNLDFSVLSKLFNDSVYVRSCEYHMRSENTTPGKFQISPTRPLLDNDELSLAYSPGVAAPCLKIYKNQESIYDYTTKGNMVAVVSDGSAVLGLGDIGADAALPVMEGKSVLFKKFADIDSIPIVIDERDPDQIVRAIASISGSWGGINLEDISGPRCFEIERKLQEALEIPVMHDDQHGTAIVAGAGLLNALHITKKDIDSIKMVMSGAGAAGIACIKFFILLGVKRENIILCDRDGVVRKDRTEGMDNIKLEFAIESTSKIYTLSDALTNSDVFVGLSAARVMTPEMLLSMAPNPIIFVMANPEPEIDANLARATRSDVIIATGRGDFPNQVNNVMAFPYIFRGALDVRAKKINDEMKLAAAYAISDLAREPVHDDVFTAYPNRLFEYGPEYIIPTPFDPRLISVISPMVAKAAMDSGVARTHIDDLDEYKNSLSSKLDPTVNLFQTLHDKVRQKPRTVVFAEGEEEKTIRAALQFVDGGYGNAILIGDEKTIIENTEKFGIKLSKKIKITNSALCDSEKMKNYIGYYYKHNQRNGKLERDCIRLVKTDRNIFSACILACGDADAMVTGLTRNYYEALGDIKTAIDCNDLLFGLSAVIKKGRIIFISDTAINASPDSKQLSEIAIKTAHIIRQLGQIPRIALVSYATFGNPNDGERANVIRESVKILEEASQVDFEWDGEMSVEVALNENLLKKYPFSRLTQPANVLIMPGLHSADISQKMLKALTDTIVVGPILVGFKQSVQIVSMTASVNEILNIAVLACSGVVNI